MYNSKAPPQPLNIITEANLRACRLAPLNEEGTAGKARAVVAFVDQVIALSPVGLGVALAPAG